MLGVSGMDHPRLMPLGVDEVVLTALSRTAEAPIGVIVTLHASGVVLDEELSDLIDVHFSSFFSAALAF